MLRINPQRFYNEAAFNISRNFNTPEKFFQDITPQDIISLKKIANKGNYNGNPIIKIVEKFSDNPEKLQKKLEKLFIYKKDEAFNALFNLIKRFDKNTAKHSQGVSKTIVDFANYLELSFDEINLLRKAGLIHDLGKISIPPDTLNKKGRLTPKEWIRVKEHARRGRSWLDKFGFSKKNEDISILVENHHNYKDSKPYPTNLKDKVEYLRLADVYNALTETCRPYNTPASPEKALKIMKEKMNKEKGIWSPENFEKFTGFIKETYCKK